MKKLIMVAILIIALGTIRCTENNKIETQRVEFYKNYDRLKSVDLSRSNIKGVFVFKLTGTFTINGLPIMYIEVPIEWKPPIEVSWVWDDAYKTERPIIIRSNDQGKRKIYVIYK